MEQIKEQPEEKIQADAVPGADFNPVSGPVIEQGFNSGGDDGPIFDEDDEGNGLKSKLTLIGLGISVIMIIILSILYVKDHKIAAEKTDLFEARLSQELSDELVKKEAEIKAAYDKKAADDAKNPWKLYKADDIYGAFTFNFPKNWYTYVYKGDGGDEHFIFLADPDHIVFNGDKKPITALRIMLLGDKYENKLENYKESDNKFKVSDITVAGLGGKKISGRDSKEDPMVNFVILPYRDKTLYVGTDKPDNFNQALDQVLSTLVLNK